MIDPILPPEAPTVKRGIRRWLVPVVSALLLALCAAGALALYLSRPLPFDRAGWADERRMRDGRRLTMADDLLRRRLLDGLTREQTLHLLGEPRPTNYFSEWDLVYWLGPERSFIGVDSEWLVVRFAAEGRVSEYRIVRD